MKVTLKGVRLSFPTLFQPKGFQGGDEGDKKFSAVFLLDKETDKKQIAALQKVIDKVAEEKWPKKLPKLKGTCLKDGEEKEDEYDGYDDTIMFVPASTSKRPPVVDKDLTPIAESDDKIYAGCYVNATIDVWAQDNQYGKRVNAQLRAVQFFKDGEAFGAAPVNAEDEFQAIEDDDDLGDLG